MYGNWFSRSGKNHSEEDMQSTALIEAKGWMDELMDREFKGRGDREKSVRGRLSDNTGIPESYLYRLQYKTQTMRDVAGEAYRRLKIYYERACENNEAAAASYRAERLGKRNHETAYEKPAPASLGMASPKAQSKKA